MVGEFDVVLVGRGVWGPFPDDEYPDDRSRDRNYDYSVLAGADGSGSENVTHAEGVGPIEGDLFKPYRVLIDVRKGKLKYHGMATRGARAASAA